MPQSIFDWNISNFDHAQKNKEPITIIRSDKRYTTGSSTRTIATGVECLVTQVASASIASRVEQRTPHTSENMIEYEVKPLTPHSGIKRRDILLRENTGETLLVADERTVNRRQTIYCQKHEMEV